MLSRRRRLLVTGLALVAGTLVCEASLRWLLSVSDLRSEVRKTNFRVGNISREVKGAIVCPKCQGKRFTRVSPQPA